MKILFLFFLSSIPYFAISQDFKTVYYNSKWEITSMKFASFYRNSGFESNLLKFDSLVTDFYLNGSPEMIGMYDKGIKEGQFIYYYPNNKVRLITNYTNNKRSGVWTTFYENGAKNMVVEYNDGKEKLLEYNDQNGNKILKNLKGKCFLDMYYNYTFQVFSQFPLDDQSEKYKISGRVLNGLKSGKWLIKKQVQITTKTGGGSWHTIKLISKAYQFNYKDGCLQYGWKFNSNSKKNRIEQDTLTYLIPEPGKIKITESLFSEPGQMIRQNYVIKAILDLRAKSIEPIEIEDESELKDFFSSNFSKYTRDCSKPIWLTIDLRYDEFGRVYVNSISPKTTSSFEKEVDRIMKLISKVKNHSQSNFRFNYRIQCLDELEFKK